MFCQDLNGDIIALTIKDSDRAVNRRVILKNQAGQVTQTLLHPIIISGKSLMIIFNTVGADDKSHYLMTQRLNENGQWTPETRIDKYWSDSFDVQRVESDHLLLFYQTRGADTRLGYREITPEQQGAYNAFYATRSIIHDTSFLTTGDGVHTLFIVRNMLSNQLVYRRNLTGTFDRPVVLYESQRLENCLLFIVKDKLYVTFMSSGNLYMCVSEDNGESFSRPARYRDKLCQDPRKAYFISQSAQSDSGVFLRQVYVDPSSPWDIQIIPELFEGFYPAPAEQYAKDSRFSNAVNPGCADEIRLLRDQIEQLRRRMFENDARIAGLSRQMAEYAVGRAEAHIDQ